MGSIYVKAMVYDRKSGHYYFANTYVGDNNGFVTLKNPVRRCREHIDIKKFVNGLQVVACLAQEYGESCNDLMLPGKYLVIEILKDGEELDWTTMTE